MNFKIGETIPVKGINCLVIDIIDGNPFVIALDTGITSKFSENENNNYNGSILERAINEWFEKLDIPTIPRMLDLTAVNNDKTYNGIKTKAAPLTFDEWHKYSEIIAPNIKHWFWLATAWTAPEYRICNADFACRVYMDGYVYPRYTGYAGHIAPAFILDKKFFEAEKLHSKRAFFAVDYLFYTPLGNTSYERAVFDKEEEANAFISKLRNDYSEDKLEEVWKLKIERIV